MCCSQNHSFTSHFVGRQVYAMDSASAHRKIELQAPEDLSYLISNVRRAAQERIDEAFPPASRSHGEEDELRSQIEALVNDVCQDSIVIFEFLGFYFFR